MHPFLILALLLVFSLIFAIAILVIARLLGPHKPTEEKITTYECGPDPIGNAWIQFHTRYYLYALVFVIFDIETVFLYPWAVAYQQVGLYAMIEMFIFLAILLVGLVYAWVKRGLEWK